VDELVGAVILRTPDGHQAVVLGLWYCGEDLSEGEDIRADFSPEFAPRFDIFVVFAGAPTRMSEGV